MFRLDRHSRAFRRLACDSRLAGVAEFLLGDQVYLHQSRLNYKPGFAGKEFYWHSDFETWYAEDGMPRMRAVSASVLLTDAGLIAFGLLVCTFLRSVPMVIVGTIIFLMGEMALRLALRGAAAFGMNEAVEIVRFMPGTALGAWAGYQEGWDPAAFAGLAAMTLGCGVIAMWRFTRADIP